MLKQRILEELSKTAEFLSGQELCEKYQVSRTAVWKVIQQLEEQGYVIEAVRNKGYRLVAAPDLLSEEIIKQAVASSEAQLGANHWIGRQVVFLENVDSTNDEAKRQAEQGAGHGTLVVAQHQTAGKGRRGRSFSSPKQEGVWMSLVIKDDIEPMNASMLTLVMGLAVVKAVKEVTGLGPQIKWPNDLILSGKKLCGILTEMSMQMDCINHIVIGIGINVHNESFPEELKSLATSVFLESGKHIPRGQLIGKVMGWFEHYYQIYMKHQDLSELMNEYNQCLVNRGRQVQVLAPKGSYTGVALGINALGELLVETENEVHQVASGEVSVRGVLGYV